MAARVLGYPDNFNCISPAPIVELSAHRGIPQNDLQFCPPLSPIQIVPRVRLCWFSFYVLTIVHRRRDYTKEKAKVVAAVWGQYSIYCYVCLTAWLFCTRMILRKGWIPPVLQIVLVQYTEACVARNWINSVSLKQRPLSSILYKSFFYGTKWLTRLRKWKKPSLFV